MKKGLTKILSSVLVPLSLLTFTIPISTEVKPKTVQVAEEKSLKQRIDEIIKPYSKEIDFGIEIVSLKDDKIIYQYEENKKLIPASCLKLVTSFVALKELGPNYKFKTEFYTDEENVYVKGHGNPYLVSEQLWLIVKELHKKGIKEIKGDIIADDSYFDDKKHSPGWYEETDEEDASRAYNAPNGALSLNFNTITVHVRAGDKIKDKPTIILDPETSYAEVKNQAGTYQYYNQIRVVREEIDGKDVITVSGGIKLGEETVSMVNVSKPTEYFLTAFKEFLKNQGIEVKGELKIGLVPEKAKLILTHESKPLSLIVRDLCKYSSNFVADQIVKTLDAEINKKQGSLEGGVEVLKSYLNKLGLKDYELVDGSGYSQKNKVTAKLVTKILQEAYNDFEIFPEFIAAQPIAGKDGSLQDRMEWLEGKARAKTGLLNDSGVSSISGYAKMGDSIAAFSILMNSKEVTAWQMRGIQDRIIEKLINKK